MDAIQRFTQAAEQSGFSVVAEQFPEGTRTAKDAAAAVGCELGQIVKSLIFVHEENPYLVLASGKNRVDESLVAKVMGIESLSIATPEQVRKATGFAIGGTPPFGHPTPIPTTLDKDLLEYETVWAAAGTPDTCFPISPQNLEKITSAVVADVAAA
tara:strand:- start:97 stop:564 length:468 start_codon:yes stop_codon:yes gene_type:complete